MFRRVVQYVFSGIAWGCFCFVMVYLIADLAGAHEMLSAIQNNFRWHALGSIFVGMGFGTTSIVYQSEKLCLWQKILIHLTVGMCIYLPTAYGLGWMPMNSIGSVLLYIALAIVIFFFVWSCFYFYHRSEVKKLNEQLEKLDSENVLRSHTDRSHKKDKNEVGNG